MNRVRNRIQISGIVQGVGFRPFVWRLAEDCQTGGWICNDSAGVTIEVEGEADSVQQFCERIRSEIPPLARIDNWLSSDLAVLNESEFQIRDSVESAGQSTPISPDVSVCLACLNELDDESDRRFQYPFINCTNCGPRFTIVNDVPYDRPNTTMNEFAMCESCQSEYDDPTSRRYHAQPNACPVCGPKLCYVEGSGIESGDRLVPDKDGDSSLALTKFRLAMAAGKIVAVKGIGGFHLVCDATNDQAVQTLRERKGRIDKPFAVMVRDVEQAKRLAFVSNRERQLLESRERPVVLLDRNESDMLAPGVAPRNNFVGVMLPYSPLHYLLINETPLIMTSGNLADEPIVHTNDEAFHRLAKMADAFLLHDRPITVACDDSVVRSVNDELLPIRRSRGFAPLPTKLNSKGPCVLAVGGEIKSTFCLVDSDHAYMSQHIGDMGNVETLDAMQKNVDHFRRLFRVEPDAIAADLHPEYLSGRWAETLAVKTGIPLLRIQHHFAHVASLIAEQRLDVDQKIIGVCLDGTGYGTDGTIWGGEFLIANAASFERLASLRPFPLPGGDASIKRPGRVALSLLWSNQIEWNQSLPPVRSMKLQERKLLLKQLEQDFNCVLSSSMGRLFDAVAALIGVRQEINYEAHAAMELEALAAVSIDSVCHDQYELIISNESDLIRLDVSGLLNAICEDMVNGVSQSRISAKFHHAVVDSVVQVCDYGRSKTGIDVVGLTGGAFQNVLLLRMARERLREMGFRVLTHSLVPPNDGGIALGQAVIAQQRLST